MIIKLDEWLRKELIKRNISILDLAKSSGLSASLINQMLDVNIDNNQGFSIDKLWDLAKGLEMTPEYLYRKVGLLPVDSGNDPFTEEAIYYFKRLKNHEKEVILISMQNIIDRREENNNNPSQ